MDMVREHFIFTGRVQGVGFRYKVSRLARHSSVTGWVRNLSDGSVEAELQGREEALDIIVKQINEDAYIHVDWMVRNRIEPDLEESGFSVRY